MSKDKPKQGTTQADSSTEQPYGASPLISKKGLSREKQQALEEYERELAESGESEGSEAECDAETAQQASERVARLNSIFDRLLLPIIIFTLLVIVGAGFLPKVCAACSEETLSEIEGAVKPAPTFSFYRERAKLLEDATPYREALQDAGYFIVEDEEGGEGFIAYKQLSDGMEIMENVTDSQGTHYTALLLEQGEGEQRTAITLMLYTERVMLAVAERGELSLSAVLDGGLQGSYASDADAVAVLELVSADTLAAMKQQYEQEMEKVLRAKA